MQLLHESTVQPDEIDSLGHMNVRFYLARMERANRRLIEGLGLPEEAFSQGFLRRTDTYTRFRREQFEGARLNVEGGVLGISEGGLESYVEIRNPDTNDVAATFIATTQLIDRSSRRAQPFPLAGDQQQAPTLTDVPEYGQPRSISLNPVDDSVSLSALDAAIPDAEGLGMMSGKRELTVGAEEVDADGWLREDIELLFLPFAKLAAQEARRHGPPVFHTKDGRRVGWAIMETRTVRFAQPRLGDRLAYFNADIALEARSRCSRRWVFDQATGQLLGVSDSVGLCIDLDARRAIPWPDEIREQIEEHLQPQFGG